MRYRVCFSYKVQYEYLLKSTEQAILELLMTKKNSTIGILLTAIGILAILVFRNKSVLLTENKLALTTPTETNTLVASPPFPFQELTIPYLRTQQFESQLAELELVSTTNEYETYTTSYESDDLTINGLLTIPAGPEPERGWPAIVFIHGYIPPTEYKTQEKYVAYVDFLARNKFVVFKIDLRGHGESEGEPSGAYYSADYIVDTLNAYAALESATFVDASRIGLWGHSMGGNVVLRTMAIKPEIPAGVIWAGAVYSYTDFQEYGIADQSYQRPSTNSPRTQKRQKLFDTHGEFDPKNEFWQQVVATNYLDDLQGAVQLHHSVTDSVVDIAYSRNLKQLLEKSKVPHELHEYAQGGHNIEAAAFNTAMTRTVSFFGKYLQ